MQKRLGRRIPRELRRNLPRYLALGLMIALGMYIVVSLVAAADAVIAGSAAAAKAQAVEDGQFGLLVPLSPEEEKALTDAGVTLEEHFYLDFQVAEEERKEAETEETEIEVLEKAENGAEAASVSVLRVFSVREKIDRAQADKGREPEKPGEVLLEKRYCEEHGISPGDEIEIGGRTFTVCGIGTSPDYDAPFRNLSDSAVDSGQFGTAFASSADYRLLKEEGGSLQAEEYEYGYLLNGKLTDRELKELLQELPLSADASGGSFFRESPGLMEGGQEARREGFSGLHRLTRFLPAQDNARIGGAAADMAINRSTGLLAGGLLMALLSYVISVFVADTIERESEVIGTLYALGVKRRELLLHYLILPTALTLTAGILGTALGYSSFGARVQMGEAYSYFSIPELPMAREPYLLLYGILMPPAAGALTNLLIIRGRLQKTALALIRREQKSPRGKNLNLGRLGFVAGFRIRHFLREIPTALTVFAGMFLALLICMIGLNCYVLCEHVRQDSAADTRYEYLYTYKYPQDTVPDGGEEALGLTLKKEAYGYRFDVTLLGIRPGNPYFDAPVEPGLERVLVSSAMAGKYGLEAGDALVLEDSDGEERYAFTVAGIVPYSPGMLAFLEIDSMRKLLGAKEDAYNMVFADHALEIDSARLHAVSSKAAVEKAAAVFGEKMGPMVRMVLAASALLFLVVMYLMLKVMLDRCAPSISMMKVFGYRGGEIRRLYLDGNLAIVALSGAVGIPLSKAVMDGIYPYLVANVAVGLNLSFPWWLYAGLYGAILVLYLAGMPLLMRRVDRILPAQALASRE